ncbi:MAG: NrdH-redoxin [Candidatus Nanohaloarchaeota archaeon QJJ-9]|nr:NrdH-redoxin [Candidatus Nanohaloarchaeota archaeon QJJ-9]
MSDIEEVKEEKAKELQEEGSKVKVYTTPTCPYCKKLKQWLEEEEIDYKEFNVAENREKAKEMIQKSGQQGVPQAEVDGQIVVGFRPQKIQNLIDGG